MDFKHLAFFLSVLLALSGCSDSQPGEASEDPATDTLAMSDESPQVKAISRRILDDPGNAALYNERALVYLKLRQPAASVNDAKRAIRLDSTNAAYYMTLVDAYFSENSTR